MADLKPMAKLEFVPDDKITKWIRASPPRKSRYRSYLDIEKQQPTEKQTDWVLLQYVEPHDIPASKGVDSPDKASHRNYKHGWRYARNTMTGQYCRIMEYDTYSGWKPYPEFEGHDICSWCGCSNDRWGSLRNDGCCHQCRGRE